MVQNFSNERFVLTCHIKQSKSFNIISTVYEHTKHFKTTYYIRYLLNEKKLKMER